VPARDDPSEGYWTLHSKNPKFSVAHGSRFLKGNLLMLTPGVALPDWSTAKRLLWADASDATAGV